MIDILWNVVSFVIALSILVAVHEWGHYYVAKLCGVKILKFSIGFGKPIYSRITSSGMEFAIASIPLGGYVRMLDGRVDQVGTKDLDVAFDQKPVLQRMAIVFAGPFVNFVFAVFCLMAIGMLGTQEAKPVVGDVLENSYAQAAGMQSGDSFVAIDNRTVTGWRDVSIELVRFSGDNNIPITFETESGDLVERNLPINGWQLDPDSTDLFGDLGFVPFRPQATRKLALVEENAPAGRAGLQVGDEIIKLDGTPMPNWRQIVEYIEPRANQNVEFEILRDGQSRELMITLGVHPDSKEQGQAQGTASKGYLGVVTYTQAWPKSYIVETQLGPIDAFVDGVDKTWRLMTTTLKMLGKLVTGDLSIKTLSGPISIAEGAGNHASAGYIAFLGFLALISVNLGIINLLPLPVLDGGHLLYFTIELLTGKSVSESVQEVGFKIGAAVLFVVMSTAILNDIIRNI